MHPYATDSSERVTIPVIVIAVAIGASFGVAKLVTASGLQDKLWWLDVPAVWGFYVLFLKGFDRWVWTWPVLRMIGLVRVPDLNGTWTGHGVSLFEDGQGKNTRFDVQVRIAQRWTQCLIQLETAHSQSESVIGGITVGEGQRPTLSYEYRNEPRALASQGMQAHRGAARLEMHDDGHLEGEYYSGRGRQGYGTLHLRRAKGRAC